MKKILALVLALVMTMSVAAISSSAAYSDADSVQYTDAVNTMSALGVMGGYADGSIRPQADVTRGAAAKMVAMVATASNATTIGYYKGTSSFADVPATHTFADAVAFCVARGIVAGYGDGNYGVADNVKGWAIAKMVLVAMGYDAKAYGMEGAGSALNTITLASQVGLFDGMKADFNATEAASREECAQIIYNALDEATVEATMNSSTGVVTYAKSGDPLLKKYSVTFDATKEVIDMLPSGVVMANQATGAYYTVIGNTNYNLETGLDLVGHMVAVVPYGAEKTDAYDANVKYYDAYAVVDLSYVVEVSAPIADADKFDAAFGKAAISDANAKVFKNYDEVTVNPNDGFVDGTSAAVGTYVLYVDATGATKLVSALTSAFKAGYVYSYSAGTAYTDGSVVIKQGNNNLLSETLYTSNTSVAAGYTDSVSLYNGIAKDDVVIVEETGSLYTVHKATTVTGKVSNVYSNSTTGVHNLTVDGKVYTLSAARVTTNNAWIGLDVATKNLNQVAINSDVELYLDQNGDVIAITAPATTAIAGLAYVVDHYTITGAPNAYGVATTEIYAQAVGMDGKEVSYRVVSENTSVEGKLCNVTEVAANPAGNNFVNYTFAEVANATGVKAAAANSAVAKTDIKYQYAGASTANDTSDDAYAYFASDVKFIYVSGAKDLLKVTVKDGVQAVAANTNYYYYATLAADKTNYNVKYVVVKAEAAADVTANTDVVFVAAKSNSVEKVSALGTDGLDTTAYKHNLYINGVYTEGVVASLASYNQGFYTYTVVNGVYYLTGLNEKVAIDYVASTYESLISTTSALTDDSAATAQFVDVEYAGMTTAQKAATPEIKDVAGLSAGDKIAAVWTVDAYGVKTIVTVYVLDRA